jgi:hypothetical protein
MATLGAELGERATIYRNMVDPAMPPGRVHPGDERHLAGAFQDNRIIPPEGVRVTDMPRAAQDLVWAIAERFACLLPDGPRAARMREIRARPPPRRLPRLRHPQAVPRPYRASDPAWQRLRPRLGPAVTPVIIAPKPDITSESRSLRRSGKPRSETPLAWGPLRCSASQAADRDASRERARRATGTLVSP